jgi:hypothetical protein
MAEGRKADTSRTVRNPLLSAAGGGFPFETFSDRPRLMPVSENSSSVLSEGEQFMCNDNLRRHLWTYFKAHDVWLCHSVSELLLLQQSVLLDNINMQM